MLNIYGNDIDIQNKGRNTLTEMFVDNAMANSNMKWL